MPRPVCSYCSERQRDKMAQLYVWWYVGEDRVSYKLRSCATCLVDQWAKTLQTANSTLTGEPTCIGCGGTLDDDSAVVYCNLYIPRQTAKEYVLDFDAACAPMIYAITSDVGERLQDRGAKVEGPRSSAPQLSPWDSLEL